jgi:hypothetical protein
LLAYLLPVFVVVVVVVVESRFLAIISPGPF